MTDDFFKSVTIRHHPSPFNTTILFSSIYASCCNSTKSISSIKISR